MRFLDSLPENTHLADVFKRFPKGVAELLDYHDILLRGPSSLSIGERELIAAFVSGLNECDFCFGAHQSYAEAFGIDFDLFDALFSDIDTAPVEDKMKPLLHYVAKLTKEPHKVIKADVDAILAAGWDEEAVHDAAAVTALFNFMNRIIFGLGVADHKDIFAARHEDNQNISTADRKARNESDLGSKHYKAFGEQIGLKSS